MTELVSDPTQMRTLAKLMERSADDLSATARQLQHRLETVWWEGPDADRFQRRWSSTQRTRMERTAQLLRATAATLRHEAMTQERTSRA